MAKQNSSKDLLNPIAPYSRLKKKEMELITSFLIESSRIYNQTFKNNIPCENGFFIKLTGEYALSNFFLFSSAIKKKDFRYWEKIPIIEVINPVWKLNLSTEAYRYITSQPKKEIFMYYLIDLIKGRFIIENEFKYYYKLNTPYSDHNNLFAILIEDLYNKPGFRILVGTVAENPNNIIIEICGNSNNLEEVLKLDSEKVFCKKKNFFTPGDQYFKNKTEERIYINPKLHFIPSSEFKSKLPKNLELIKSHINKNRKAYLTFIGASNNEFSKWTNLAFHFMYKQMPTHFLLGILPNFSKSWNVIIEKEVLEVLRNIKENEFLHYLNLITKFTECLAIDDFKLFHRLNEIPDDDFLILPLVLENTNLKTIFSILSVGKSELNDEYEYQLRLINFLNTNSYKKQIEEFRNSKKYVKINDICEKPGIKSFVLIEKNKNVIPIFKLNQIMPTRQGTKILFLCSFPKNDDKYVFGLSFDQGSSNTYNKKIKVFDDSNESATRIVEIQTNKPVYDRYTVSLKITGWWDLVYKDETMRVIQNLELQFLFDVDFFRKDVEKIKTTENYKDFYHQLLIYLKHYLESKDFKSVEYLVQSFSSLIFNLESLNEKSIMTQINIVEHVSLYFLKELDLNNIEILYKFLSILGLINAFPSKKVSIDVSGLEKVLNIIGVLKSKYLEVFKVRLNYNSAIRGLAKILACERMRSNKSLRFYFDTIIDYEVLSSVLEAFIESLEKNKIFISFDEMNDIIEYTNHFAEKSAIFIRVKILNLVYQPDKIISVLLNEFFNHLTTEEKKRLFLDLLKSRNLDNESLLNFLQFLSSNNVYKEDLFAPEDIKKFIYSHLNNRKNLSKSDFNVIKKILEVIKDESNLKGFDINGFVKNQVLLNGFHECIELLLVDPTFIPEIFDKWIEKNISKNKLKEDLIMIEKEINAIPETFRKASTLCAINRLHENYSLTNTEKISKDESPILLEAYKEFLSNKIEII